MNATTIFALLEKGLTLVPILIEAGTEVIPLIQRLAQLAKGGAEGTVTQAELDSLETDLDAALADFNADLPPAAPPAA